MKQVFRPFVFLVPALAIALAGCDTNKSRNPLSPDLAGPIEGVEITAPRPVEPGRDARMRHDAQPVVLTIENAQTNGERPLFYGFDVARDPGMSDIIFSNDEVPSGPDGRTSVTIAGNLTPGRDYHWRARAADGANTGPHSEIISFHVYPPISLSVPEPVSPLGGGTIDTTQPVLRTGNANRTGAPEHTWYDFEVALDGGFGAMVAAVTADEGPGQTTVTVGPLQNNTLFFWRVRARSESVTGDWSAPQSFRTPSPAAPPPPPPPPPGGGGLPPSNPGPRPRPSEGQAMVAAVIADMHRRGIPMDGDCGGFEITRRVAWAFANRGAGLERKPGGRNCRGHSIDIVLFTDGQSVDILIGSGVDNGATWQEHGVLSDWRDWWIAPTNPD